MPVDCSNHKQDILGEYKMSVVAEMIGDLHYKALSNLLWHLHKKLMADAQKDADGGREALSTNISLAGSYIEGAHRYIERAWEISKPFMDHLKLLNP